MDIFWRSEHYQYLLCMRWWFSLPYTITNFLFDSLKLLPILKKLSETFFVIGWCSLVQTCHWLQGKCTRINLSQAASGMILKAQQQQQHHYMSAGGRGGGGRWSVPAWLQKHGGGRGHGYGGGDIRVEGAAYGTKPAMQPLLVQHFFTRMSTFIFVCFINS